MFVVYENLAGAVAQLRYVLGANGSDALGVLPAVVIASSQAVRACGIDHHGLLPCLRMLISFWPPILVIVGTMLLRDAFTDKVKALPTPDQHFQKKLSKIKTLDVDFAARHSTYR
jgi:hypothetical protein